MAGIHSLSAHSHTRRTFPPSFLRKRESSTSAWIPVLRFTPPGMTGEQSGWHPLPISAFPHPANPPAVIPAKAGIQCLGLGSRAAFHSTRNDGRRDGCFFFFRSANFAGMVGVLRVSAPSRGAESLFIYSNKKGRKNAAPIIPLFLRFSARPGARRRVRWCGQRRPFMACPCGPDPAGPAMLGRNEGGTDTARRLCRHRASWAQPNELRGQVPFTRAAVSCDWRGRLAMDANRGARHRKWLAPTLEGVTDSG